MIRQYGPQRHRYEVLAGRSRPVGTIPVGTVARIGIYGTMRSYPVLVLAWLPREISAARAGHWTFGRTGHQFHAPESRYVARMGHLALCRDLRTGKTQLVSDAFLRDPSDY
ncbi:MAG: hypothetical protein NVS1B2_16120 [Vulcanimicrobiaceae bacterium]